MPTTLTIAGAEDDPQPGDVGLPLAPHEPARLAEQRAARSDSSPPSSTGAASRPSSACR